MNRLQGIDVDHGSGWAVGYYYDDNGTQNTLALRLDCGGDGGGDDGEPPAELTVLVSSTSGGNVDGTAFRDEDILQRDDSGWSMYFDGSDVGLGGADIDAVAPLDDGSLLLSLNQPFTVGGLATDDSDILRFQPTSLGSNTAGTFSLFVDGSDIGLTTNGEDVDSLTVIGDGSTVELLVGFVGRARVPGLVVNDEDLAVLALSSSGSATAGSWSASFDGSQVGLTSSTEDVWGASLLDGDLYLATQGAFAVAGASGDGSDVLACAEVTSSPTACQFSLFQDGGAVGIGAENVDALAVLP